MSSRLGFSFIILATFANPMQAELPCSTTDINTARANALAPKLSAEQRITLMVETRKILERMRAEDKSEMPRSFYLSCKRSYEEIFVTLYDNAPNQAKGRADFKESVGDFFAFRDDLSNAILFYDDAAKINPQNSELRLKAWHIFMNLESRKLLEMSPAEREKHLPVYRRESLRRIDDIAALKSDNNNIAAEVLLGKADLNILEGNWQEGIKLLDQVLAKTPNNLEALNLSAKTLLRNKMFDQACPKLEKLTNFPEYEKWAFDQLILIYLSSEKSNELAEISNRALKKYPNEALYYIGRGLSLLYNQRIDEAQEVVKSLSKIKNKPKDLTNKFTALLLEILGDREITAGKISRGIIYYKKAISQSTESRYIRSKTALALLNYARSKNFMPAETMAQDMDFAIDYALPLTREAVVSEDLLLDIIEICVHSNKEKFGPELCDRYQKDFKTFKSFEGLLNCSKLYNQASQKTKAREMLEAAMKEQRFATKQSQIFKELQRIGL